MQDHHAGNAQSIAHFGANTTAPQTIASRLASVEIRLLNLEEQVTASLATHEKRLSELELRLG